MSIQEARRIHSAWRAELPATTLERSSRYLEHHPDRGDVWILRADALIDLARYGEARAALDHATRLTPDDHRHLPLLYRGHLSAARGDHRRAVHWCREAARRRPGRPQAHLLLGDSLLRLGRADDAVEALRVAARFPETRAAAHHALACAHRARGAYRDAIGSLRRSLGHEPRNPAARAALADLERALALGREARSPPRHASGERGALERIHRERNSGRATCAMLLAEAYVARHPRHWFAWTVFGDMLTLLERFEDAQRALRTAMRRAPPDSVHNEYSYLGHLYEARGRYRTAEAWYRKALEARPDKGSYHVFLGAALAVQGRLDEAEERHRTATRLRGVSDEAYLNLGYVLRARGRYRDARRSFVRALRADPRYREARLALRDVDAALAIDSRRT